MLISKTHTIPISRKAAPFEKEAPPPSHIVSFSSDREPHILSIVHKTTYSYSSPILLSKQLIRLQPITDSVQTVLHYKLDISIDGAEIHNFNGAFSNSASFVGINKPYSELKIVAESVVAVQSLETNLAFLHHPRTLPLIWMPWDRVMMQAYLQPPELPEAELFELAEYAMQMVNRNHNDVLAVLTDMNTTIYRDYSYVPGFSSLATTPYQTFKSQKGVCQDFANLLICLARLLNIPARYRMGYVYTSADYENTMQSDATHAWVEIYLPYLGWMGFDPTNGCLVGKNHVKVACGRYFTDATPTSGAIFKSEEAYEETMSATVQVLQLND